MDEKNFETVVSNLRLVKKELSIYKNLCGALAEAYQKTSLHVPEEIAIKISLMEDRLNSFILEKRCEAEKERIKHGRKE